MSDDPNIKPAVFDTGDDTTTQPFVQPALDGAVTEQPAHVAWDAQPKPVVHSLRTDGPTLSQYVAAGYNPATYPPPGYAAVPEAEVVQPTAHLTERVPAPSRQFNPAHADELSLAAKHAMAPMHVAPPEVKLPPGRFKLAYEYNGQSILERHRTIPHALASIRRLKMMGIVPATSTDPAPVSAAA